MKVKQVLDSIRQKTALSDEEYAKLEKLFGEFMMANIIDQLDGTLSPSQKEEFIMLTQKMLSNSNDPSALQNIDTLLQQAGYDQQKAQEVVGSAQDFAFKKITESLANV